LLGNAARKYHSKQTRPYCVRSVLHMICFDDDPVSTAANSNSGTENATHYIVIYSFNCCLQVRCPLQSSKSTLQTIVCNQAAAVCSQTAALVSQLHAPAHTNTSGPKSFPGQDCCHHSSLVTNTQFVMTPLPGRTLGATPVIIVFMH
jgi:hypothetical protein